MLAISSSIFPNQTLGFVYAMRRNHLKCTTPVTAFVYFSPAVSAKLHGNPFSPMALLLTFLNLYFYFTEGIMLAH